MSAVLVALIVLFSFYAKNGHSVPVMDDETEMGQLRCEMSRHPYTLPDTETDQCDAYLRCEAGRVSRELCDDGLVYHLKDNLCDMPQRVDCTGRERLQPAKGSGNCPRLNGLYPHGEFCDQYYFCRLGIPLLVTCPTGLVYDLKAGVCEFPDEAQRPGCMPNDVLGFVCPPVSNSSSLPFGDHARYPKPDDCRYFFKCLKNGYPRLGGCEIGMVFNPATGSCDQPSKVPGCKNYYDEEEEDRPDDDK